jgi:hypothetical protein
LYVPCGIDFAERRTPDFSPPFSPAMIPAKDAAFHDKSRLQHQGNSTTTIISSIPALLNAPLRDILITRPEFDIYDSYL